MQTLWFDALILRMMTVPGPPTKLIFDELAALQKLWQLHTALAEGRKHQPSPHPELGRLVRRPDRCVAG